MRPKYLLIRDNKSHTILIRHFSFPKQEMKQKNYVSCFALIWKGEITYEKLGKAHSNKIKLSQSHAKDSFCAKKISGY